ncbi:MAG: type II secretion system F family protein [Anaerolineales bacterium]
MTPVLIIGGIVALWVVAIVGYLVLGRRQSAVEERLGQITKAGRAVAPAPKSAAPRASPLGEIFNRAVAGRGFADNIQRDLARADVKLNVGEYIALHVFAAFAMGGLGWFISGGPSGGVIGIAFAVVGGIVGLFIPRIYVGFAQGRRLQTFDNQLGDMLNLVVNGLRAGYSSMQALESVGKELPPPISVEFRRVVQEIQLGIPQEAALANLTRRIPSPDLDFVVTAINVQREVGGSLAEILDNISYTIRERVRIKGEIRTLTAQGMMTGYVVSLLPIGLGLFLYLVNRPYMSLFWTAPPFIFGIPICGISMLIVAALMIGIGFAIVMKIVDIEV